MSKETAKERHARLLREAREYYGDKLGVNDLPWSHEFKTSQTFEELVLRVPGPGKFRLTVEAVDDRHGGDK